MTLKSEPVQLLGRRVCAEKSRLVIADRTGPKGKAMLVQTSLIKYGCHGVIAGLRFCNQEVGG